MPYNDLRSFLKHLEEKGEIAHIEKEMDTKFEISSYTLAAYIKGKLHSEPALFFKKVKGHHIPVVTNLFGTYRRFAMAFGLNEDNLFQGLMERYERLIEPKKVDTGPCKENIWIGEEVDLTRFPIMWWNEHDAGPYITAGIDITKDLNTGKHNCGRYRLQFKGKDCLGILLSERQHIGKHYLIAKDKGEKTLDIAIAIGCEPSLEIASQVSIPYEWEEYAWAAGNKQSAEPIEVVKAETVDLYVPAKAEIIIEGKIPVGEFEKEGPLGEFTGYYSGEYENPVIHITAITHRDNPIMVGIHMANCPGENLLLGTYPENIMLYRAVKEYIPELTAIRYLFAWFSVVAQVDRKKKYPGLPRRVADCIWATKAGSYCKNVIVVDDDVDIWNESQIFWAMSVRSQPEEDVWISGRCPGYGIDPSEKEIHVRSMGKVGVSRFTSRLLWDATESLELKPEIQTILSPPGFAHIMAGYDEVVKSALLSKEIREKQL